MNHNSPLLSTFLRYVSRSPWNFREPLAESWLKLSIRSIELWFSTESTARATACFILWSRKDPARLCFGLRSARKAGCQTSHQVIVKGNSKSFILIFRHFFGVKVSDLTIPPLEKTEWLDQCPFHYHRILWVIWQTTITISMTQNFASFHESWDGSPSLTQNSPLNIPRGSTSVGRWTH